MQQKQFDGKKWEIVLSRAFFFSFCWKNYSLCKFEFFTLYKKNLLPTSLSPPHTYSHLLQVAVFPNPLSLSLSRTFRSICWQWVINSKFYPRTGHIGQKEGGRGRIERAKGRRVWGRRLEKIMATTEKDEQILEGEKREIVKNEFFGGKLMLPVCKGRRKEKGKG